MKVDCIELYDVKVPLPSVFYPSWIPGYPQHDVRFTLVRIATEDGVEGWSAGAAMGREREGLGSLIGPYLIGMDPLDIGVIQQRLREVSYLGWRNWWIEPAFWDIIGKVKGKPVWELLGGKGGDVSVYASNGEVCSPQKNLEISIKRYEEGFKGVKLRVHSFKEDDDIKQVQEAAREIRSGFKIGVDANQGWRVTVIDDAPLWDIDRAKRFVDKMAELGVSWVEEPLPMDDYVHLSELSAYSKVPIAGGELNGGGFSEFRMMIDNKCYTIYQPDATFCGGIEQVRHIMELCLSKGFRFTPHTWTNGIGLAINLAVFASNPERDKELLEFPYNPPSWIPEARDAILTEPFIPQKGRLKIPDKPGLGIEINKKALKKYGTRFFKMTPLRLAISSIKERGLKQSIELAKKKKEGAHGNKSV
ncbi:MAG: mandelate racemase/muconate lactonizing enzyme family protein [bacterium]